MRGILARLGLLWLWDVIWGRARHYLTHYRVPAKLGVLYVLGACLLLLLGLLILSGVFLAFGYVPSVDGAFDSVTVLNQNAPFVRALHSSSASVFFLCCYAHMVKGIWYGSYHAKQGVWSLGVFLWWLFMMQGFLGFVLTWGKISYWSAQVVLDAPSALPWFGNALSTILKGAPTLSQSALSRAHIAHVLILPFSVCTLVCLHLAAIHMQPLPQSTKTVPFHPYQSTKDLLACSICLFVIAFLVFFLPEGFGLIIDPDNQAPPDATQTPAHMRPLWYLAPFYGVLLAVPNKVLGLFGALMMACAPLVLPHIDKDPRPMHAKSPLAFALIFLVGVSFVGLGILAMLKTTVAHILAMRVLILLMCVGFVGILPATLWRRT